MSKAGNCWGISRPGTTGQEKGRAEKCGRRWTFSCAILIAWNSKGTERPPGYTDLAAPLFPVLWVGCLACAARPARRPPRPGPTPGWWAAWPARSEAAPVRGSSLRINATRGKESPVFLPIKPKKFWPVTLRKAKPPGKFIPPFRGDNRAGQNGPKCETGADGKNETDGPLPPERERGPPAVAEQKKTAAKKAAHKKPKAEKPEVLTGTMPEWASTTVIAQLLGFISK